MLAQCIKMNYDEIVKNCLDLQANLAAQMSTQLTVSSLALAECCAQLTV